MKVYVIVSDTNLEPVFRVGSPRLKNPEQAAHFIKEMSEDVSLIHKNLEVKIWKTKKLSVVNFSKIQQLQPLEFPPLQFYPNLSRRDWYELNLQ